MSTSSNNRLLRGFFLFGVAFGLCFPIMALGIDLWVKNIPFSYENIVQLHFNNPIHFIIDSAPLVLSLTSFMIGKYVLKRERQFKEQLQIQLLEAQAVMAFTEELLKGNFTAELPAALRKGDRQHALQDLKKQLQANKERESQKAWTIEQAARTNQILRNYPESPVELCEVLLSAICKELQALKGAIYTNILATPDNAEGYRLTAGYAFHAKEREWVIEKGNGLSGQILTQGEAKLINHIPEGAFPIFSGLGSSKPVCLALLPLIFHEHVLGIMEVAFLKQLAPYQFDFLKQLSEGLASALSVHRHKMAPPA